MRLSRILRSSDPDAGDESVGFRSVVLWTVVAVAILAGIVLYFKYERQLTPILG